MKATTKEERIPPCAASMGCLCAGHARGQPVDSLCDTNERETERDWYNIRHALAFHYNAIVKQKNAALKGKRSTGPRASELAMELVDLRETYERVRALHPAAPPLPAKAKRAGGSK